MKPEIVIISAIYFEEENIMIITKITINGRYPSLNDYTNACRTSHHAGAAVKRKAEARIKEELSEQLNHPLNYPIGLDYKYYERNRKRDKSNISSFFHKVFEDSLVGGKWIPGDGWKYISRFSDTFDIDCTAPRIEVTICEYGDETKIK